MTTSINGPNDHRIGRIVNNHRLERVLGKGGMGTVYLASRTDDLAKKVALKFLNQDGGVHSHERFMRERRILASLEHPNIARFIDSGRDEFGCPFLIMEYVDGIPLDQHLAARSLTLNEKLTLFGEVCKAVSFAHQKLIIHRDIKPENIMITGGGGLQLLDFGIAGLLDPITHEPSDTIVTRERMMTPAYASPEQILGEPMSVATDIYTLGVVLFQMILGYLPKGPSSGLQHMQKADPLHRAAKVAQLNGKPKLARDLQGDLEAILYKALRGHPEDRYASVEQMNADIQAYLNGHPVQARTPSLYYLATKFIKRNRFQVGLVTGAFVLVVAFAAIAYGERIKVLEERNLVGQEKQVAETALAFMEGLFANARREGAVGNQVTVKEILDRGAERIGNEFVEQPEIEARLVRTMCQAYMRMGLFQEGLALAERTLTKQEKRNPADEAIRAGLYAWIGAFHHNQGKFDPARTAFEQGLQIFSRGVGDPRDLYFLRDNYASLLGQMGHFQEAEALLLANRAMESGGGANTHNTLGLLYYKWGKLEQAESMLRRSLELFAEAGLKSGDVTSNLALVLVDLEKYEEAARHFKRILESDLCEYGDNHPSTATSLNNLGMVYSRMGRHEEAEQYLLRSLEIKYKNFGKEHQTIGDSLSILATVYMETEQYEKALEVSRSCLELDQKYLAEDHRFLAADHKKLADILFQLGELRDAEFHARKALMIHNMQEQPDERAVMEATYRLALIVTEGDRPGDGLILMHQAWEKALAHHGSDHEDLEIYRSALDELCSKVEDSRYCGPGRPM